MQKTPHSWSLVESKQASKKPKWVLKLLLPYLKNPREPQKETAAINRKHGNGSLVLKLGIEFLWWQTPWGRLRDLTCLLWPARSNACSFLPPFQLLLSWQHILQKSEKYNGEWKQDFLLCFLPEPEALCKEREASSCLQTPLGHGTAQGRKQTDGTPLFQWAANMVLPSRHKIWETNVYWRE